MKHGTNTTRPFSVLLLYPDYLSDNYGEETYLAHVTATTPQIAINKARREAKRENKGCESPDDFRLLFCASGHIISHI